MHNGDEERDKAEMIFYTVHRSKGMEYDIVYLVNDFITEEKLKEIKDKHKKDKAGTFNIAKLNEEINLLYVAITRTKNKLYIPETLLPKEFPASLHINKVKVSKTNDDYTRYLSEQVSYFSKQSY